jgi:hypothetical protein
MSMESNTPCEHDWALIYQEDTWSGPKRLSTCSDCRAFLHEWLPRRLGAMTRIPLPRHGGDPTRVDATVRLSDTSGAVRPDLV